MAPARVTRTELALRISIPIQHRGVNPEGGADFSRTLPLGDKLASRQIVSTVLCKGTGIPAQLGKYVVVNGMTLASQCHPHTVPLRGLLAASYALSTTLEWRRTFLGGLRSW